MNEEKHYKQWNKLLNDTNDFYDQEIREIHEKYDKEGFSKEKPTLEDIHNHRRDVLLKEIYPLDPYNIPIPINKKVFVSVVIPCIDYHFEKKIIRPCLESILKGTIVPNEIIIVLSDTNVDEFQERWNKINKYHYYNKFKFIYISEKLSCGEARQTGLDSIYKLSDLVVFCDADDTYHPQRIEIIVHFFKNYNIKTLNHLFMPDSYQFRNYNISQIQILSDPETIYNYYFPDKKYKPFLDQNDAYYGQFLKKTVTDGHMAVKPPIKIKFENKTVNCDSDFLYRVCYEHKSNMIIGACLSKYTKAFDWLNNDHCKKYDLYNSIKHDTLAQIKYI